MPNTKQTFEFDYSQGCHASINPTISYAGSGIEVQKKPVYLVHYANPLGECCPHDPILVYNCIVTHALLLL